MEQVEYSHTPSQVAHSVFSPEEPSLSLSKRIIEIATEKQIKLATAESCTGGLVAALFTEQPGASVLDRAFVTYSIEAKQEMIGVPPELIAAHGVVSSEVAKAMVQGALAFSRAQVAVSITGWAGPSGDNVGLVWLGAGRKVQKQEGEDEVTIVTVEKRFGNIGRGLVRREAARTALELMLT